MSVITVVAGRIFPRARNVRKFNLDGVAPRARELWPIFVEQGKRTRLSPYLLLAIAIGESDLIPTAKGPNVPSSRVPGGNANGLGLMQLMTFHDTRYGGNIRGLLEHWQEPAFNLQHGADILAYQVNARGGVEKGLAGYGGFSSWLKDPSSVTPGGPKDAGWYIDEALGRAWVLQFANEAGSLGLGPAK